MVDVLRLGNQGFVKVWRRLEPAVRLIPSLTSIGL
jgi:hypothetical protein